MDSTKSEKGQKVKDQLWQIFYFAYDINFDFRDVLYSKFTNIINDIEPFDMEYEWEKSDETN